MSLDEDKARKSADFDVWLPNLLIDQRTVGIHRTEGYGDCATYVQSGGAAVDTIVSVHGADPLPSEICDRAIAFTRATIDKMPL